MAFPRSTLFLLAFLLVHVRMRADEVALIGVGEPWKYWYATASPSPDWAELEFDDSDWLIGDSGFGLSHRGENTPLAGLERGSGAVFFRKEFTVLDPATVGTLTLRCDWQGGFVAYLNGQEVTRRNLAGLPGEVVPIEAGASTRYAGVAEDILLLELDSLLKPGRNLLALQANPELGRPVDVVLVPELLANFNRGPYLQSVLADRATVLWRTPIPLIGKVELSRQSDLSGARFLVAPEMATSQEITITGLDPGVRYFYRVWAGINASPIASFRTLPNQGALDFVLFGDSGAGSAAQFSIARALSRRSPDLVVHLGDVVYPNFSLGQTDTRCLSVYRTLLRTTPFFFTWGNHDLYGGTEPFNTAFRQPTNNTPLSDHLTERTLPQFYYSFDAGDAHFAVLFWPYSNQYYMRENCPQLQWLEADLAASSKPWKFLCLHHPVNTSGGHRNDDLNLNLIPDRNEVAARLMPVAARHGVRLIFSGHDHNYERFQPLNQTHTVVSGGGGIILYGLVERDPNSATFQSRWHYSEVQLRGDQLRLVATDRQGVAFDALEFRRTPLDSDDPDGDGLGPAAEAAAGTRADSPDTDGDGLSDGWEILEGLNPTVSDATDNAAHLAAFLGTPLPRPLTQLSSQIASDGQLELRWLGAVGHRVVLENAVSPGAPWEPMSGFREGVPLATDPQRLAVPTLDGTRFFRVRLIPE